MKSCGNKWAFIDDGGIEASMQQHSFAECLNLFGFGGVKVSHTRRISFLSFTFSKHNTMSFIAGLLGSLRRRRKGTVNPRSKGLEQENEEHHSDNTTQPDQVGDTTTTTEATNTPVTESHSPSSHSVNVEGLQFKEARDLAYLLGSTWSEKPAQQQQPLFPAFEHLLNPKNEQQEQAPRRSNSSYRSTLGSTRRLFRGALPRNHENRLSLYRPVKNTLKTARSTPNFGSVKNTTTTAT